jgi:hypothetical protein
MKAAPGREHERLEVLVGRWRTEGRTQESPDSPAAEIVATDTYEWLPGGFASFTSWMPAWAMRRLRERRSSAGIRLGRATSRSNSAAMGRPCTRPHSARKERLSRGAQRDHQIRRPPQCRRQHHHGGLAATGRRFGLAALDGNHAVEASW